VSAQPGCDEGLGRAAQGAIFYIIEEAISNARKHANAETIWVRLFLDSRGAFVAEIEDDGEGFDEDAVRTTYDRSGSLGLVNMEERAEMAGGRVTVATAPGAGTRVRLTVPPDEGS
jgi:signal transduction histidine kinase